VTKMSMKKNFAVISEKKFPVLKRVARAIFAVKNKLYIGVSHDVYMADFDDEKSQVVKLFDGETNRLWNIIDDFTIAWTNNKACLFALDNIYQSKFAATFEVDIMTGLANFISIVGIGGGTNMTYNQSIAHKDTIFVRTSYGVRSGSGCELKKFILGLDNEKEKEKERDRARDKDAEARKKIAPELAKLKACGALREHHGWSEKTGAHLGGTTVPSKWSDCIIHQNHCIIAVGIRGLHSIHVDNWDQTKVINHPIILPNPEKSTFSAEKLFADEKEQLLYVLGETTAAGETKGIPILCVMEFQPEGPKLILLWACKLKGSNHYFPSSNKIIRKVDLRYDE